MVGDAALKDVPVGLWSEGVLAELIKASLASLSEETGIMPISLMT